MIALLIVPNYNYSIIENNRVWGIFQRDGSITFELAMDFGELLAIAHSLVVDGYSFNHSISRLLEVDVRENITHKLVKVGSSKELWLYYKNELTPVYEIRKL